jgi:cell shape-determining protein MreC
MAELNSIQIPKSVNTLETLVTRRSLMRLMQIAYVFDKIKKEKKNTSQEFSGMKRDEPNLKQLLALVSEKKDRKKNSSVCF